MAETNDQAEEHQDTDFHLSGPTEPGARSTRDAFPSTGVSFRPVTINVLYPTIERGLRADVLAARALGASPFTVCSGLVVASHGQVTDVLAVPTDSVAAQLEHIFATSEPTAAKISTVHDAATVEVIFKLMSAHLNGPIILDLTLSGPSGEDITGPDGLSAFVDRFGETDLVTLRRSDAELLAGMQIPSLDDAQVAVQRIAQQGAPRVLLRCGRIATHYFDLESTPQYAVDLYFDGEDFALFEAPYLDVGTLHGASSAYLLHVLRSMTRGTDLIESLQQAKGYITEELKPLQERDNAAGSLYVQPDPAPTPPPHA